MVDDVVVVAVVVAIVAGGRCCRCCCCREVIVVIGRGHGLWSWCGGRGVLVVTVVVVEEFEVHSAKIEQVEPSCDSFP